MMKVLRIEATRDFIRLHTDSDGPALLRECVPTVGPKPGRVLTLRSVAAEGGVVALPRLEDGRDRIFSRYDLFVDGEIAEGARYVTDVAGDVPANAAPYPQPDIIKTLGLPGDMAKRYGIRQGLMNINLPALMAAAPGPDTLAYPFGGRVYHVRKSAVAAIDAHMLSGP